MWTRILHCRRRRIPAAVVALAVASSIPPAGATPSERPSDYRSTWQAASEPYKKALQATNQGKADEAMRDLHVFRARWDIFRANFQEKPPQAFAKDKAWKRDLLAVAAWAEQAERELAAGEPKKSHATLEKVRLRWMEMRSRQDVCTYGDHLTRFHDPMEAVVETVQGRTPETLTDRELNTLRKAAPELMRLWLPVLDAPANGLPAARARTRAGMARQVGNLVASLDRAVRAGDKAAILESATKLRPAFAALYMQFG